MNEGKKWEKTEQICLREKKSKKQIMRSRSKHDHDHDQIKGSSPPFSSCSFLTNNREIENMEKSFCFF